MHQQLGFVPTVGWQIDAFGHTSTNAALHAAMGFDAFFFMRLDHNIAQRRRQQLHSPDVPEAPSKTLRLRR